MSDVGKLTMHTATVDVTPSEIDYDERTLTTLDTHLQQLIADNKLQGASYLLARHGKIFAYKSMGKLTHREDSTDLVPDSIRGIASITKLFTAVAIMQLVEAGKIYLTQQVCELIDEFNTNMHKEIQIIHILVHTSGLIGDPGYYREPYTRGWWERLEAQNVPGFPEERKINWIKAILSGPSVCKPGAEFHYSSAGYMILGEIISRASGVQCEKYIMENIVKPLALNGTFFNVPREFHHRVCHTNDWSEDRLKRDEYSTDKLPSTAGGLYSTLKDLFIFGQMVLQKGTYNGVKILSRKAIEYMTKNHLGKNTPGYCWGVDHKEYTHGIGFNLNLSELLSPSTVNHEGAGRSMLYMDPEEDLVIAAFVPTNIGWLPESLISVRSIIYSGLN